MARAIAAVGIAMAMLFYVGLNGGLAQHHHHPKEHVSLHDTFYKSWMRPDDRRYSCCDNRDCAPAAAVRYYPYAEPNLGGRWEAQRASDGKWLTIPREKVEYDRDSPDGRAHMCSMGETVFCFIAGAGG